MRAVLALLCAAIAIWIFLSFCTLKYAHAHSWYPHECCHDMDCHPIDCDEIEEQKDGSVKWDGYSFGGRQIRPSQDNKCHACIFSNGLIKTPLCIFTQQGY